MRTGQVVALSIAVVVGVPAFNTRAEDAPSTNKTISVEFVQKGIVGAWNYVEKNDRGVMSWVISFDSQGRVTANGLIGAGGKVFSFDNGYAEGKIKYRLEEYKDGPGVLVIEINPDGKVRNTYIVESIETDKLSMRDIGNKTREHGALLVWTRIADPVKVQGEKSTEETSE